MTDHKKRSWTSSFFLMFGVVLIQTALISTIYKNQLGDLFKGSERTYLSDILIAPIDRLINWDFGAYLLIAENGYRYLGNELAYPPLFPMLIRGIGTVLFGQFRLAGFLVSWISIYFACRFLYQNLVEKFDSETSLRAIQYMLIFPTAFYFFTGYTESLFLFLLVISWISAEKGKWWSAGILGSLATLTRFVGVFLVIPYAIFWIREPHKTKIRAAAAIGLIPLAYMSWFLFAESHFGIRPSEILLHNWTLRIEWPWVGLAGTVQGILSLPFENFIFGYLDLFVLAITFLTMLWNFYRKRVPESVFMLAIMVSSMLKISAEGYLISVSRYMVVLFPMFIALSEWGNSKLFQRVWFLGSFTLNLFSTALFVFGYWVA